MWETPGMAAWLQEFDKGKEMRSEREAEARSLETVGSWWDFGIFSELNGMETFE